MEIKTIEHLKDFKVSPVEGYWVKKSGKKTLVLKAGDSLDFSVLEKFPTLEFESVVEFELIESLSSNLAEYNELHFDRDRIKKREEIFKDLSSAFWIGESEVSFLSVVLAFSKNFYNLSDELEKVLLESSVDNYKRSHVVGTMSVIYAMALGYLSPKLLIDIYNISFVYDISLFEKGLSTNDIEIIENERQRLDGEGVTPEFKKVESHVEESYRIVKEKYSGSFHDSENIKWILNHHQQLIGEVDALNGDEMSDLEKILICCNKSFKYASPEYSSKKGKSFVKNILEKMNVDQRVEKQIEKCFQRASA